MALREYYGEPPQNNKNFFKKIISRQQAQTAWHDAVAANM